MKRQYRAEADMHQSSGPLWHQVSTWYRVLLAVVSAKGAYWMHTRLGATKLA